MILAKKDAILPSSTLAKGAWRKEYMMAVPTLS